MPFLFELPKLPSLLGPAVGSVAILLAIAWSRLRS